MDKKQSVVHAVVGIFTLIIVFLSIFASILGFATLGFRQNDPANLLSRMKQVSEGDKIYGFVVYKNGFKNFDFDALIADCQCDYASVVAGKKDRLFYFILKTDQKSVSIIGETFTDDDGVFVQNLWVDGTRVWSSTDGYLFDSDQSTLIDLAYSPATVTDVKHADELIKVVGVKFILKKEKV